GDGGNGNLCHTDLVSKKFLLFSIIGAESGQRQLPIKRRGRPSDLPPPQLVKKDFDKLVDGGASSPATATPTSFF
ncbi:MAG: hypothetical protein SOW23_12055, partial [Eubacteriales bacterium]|nr:hypothetical protein [Eubacteriales bacterium]